ncbi:hypothetical protein TNCV_2592121 [Trichonephila clavipes]|nr:hypothetical protein TNCV_2592121 [Trichonephila clavipes]
MEALSGQSFVPSNSGRVDEEMISTDDGVSQLVRTYAGLFSILLSLICTYLLVHRTEMLLIRGFLCDEDRKLDS